MNNFLKKEYLISLSTIIFLIAVNMQICSSQITDNTNNFNSSRDFIEESFPYGRLGFNDFIKKNLKYPSKARTDSIEGTVYISFIVNSSGYTSDIKIKKGIRYDIDNECQRVVKLIRWKPQSSSNRPVNVNITLPIKFDLSSLSEDKYLSYILTPNPAGHGFTIRTFSSEHEVQYEMQDTIGKVIRAGYITTGETVRVNTSDLSEGKYSFRLFSDAIGIEKRDTLIIQR